MKSEHEYTGYYNFSIMFVGAICLMFITWQAIYSQEKETDYVSLKSNTMFIHGKDVFSISREGSQDYTYNEHSARNVYPKSGERGTFGIEGGFPASKLTVSPSKGVKIKKQRYNLKVASTISSFGTKLCSLKSGDITVEVYYPNISTILEMNTDKSKEAWIVVEGIGISDVATTPIRKELVRVESLILVCKSKGEATRVMKLVFWAEDQPSSWYDNQTQTTLEEIYESKNN